jgi:hypothetical protein
MMQMMQVICQGRSTLIERFEIHQRGPFGGVVDEVYYDV